jgi:hypothetical protein
LFLANKVKSLKQKTRWSKEQDAILKKIHEEYYRQNIEEEEPKNKPFYDYATEKIIEYPTEFPNQRSKEQVRRRIGILRDKGEIASSVGKNNFFLSISQYCLL